MKKDIENQDDIKALVGTFYSRVVQHPDMSAHFANTDFEHHMPRMIAFWAFVLLDAPYHTGNVFDAHRHLDINQSHFDIWINTFCEVTDSLFEGKIADKAKQNAQVIGFTFASKMKMLRENTPPSV